MTHASLCTGIGSCEMAASWMGWNNAFSCEINEFCQRVLNYHYPNSKHYGNIYETDFSEWRGKIDVLTAGFPCQPFSYAGSRKGADDDRYLWPEVLRVIQEVKPRWFLGENVAGITSMVLPGDEITVGSYKDAFGESYQETEMYQQFVVDRICDDLESIGYSVQPIVIPACAVGAPHRRDRIWFIANRSNTGVETMQPGREDGIFSVVDASNSDNNGSPAAKIRPGDRKGDYDNEAGANTTEQPPGCCGPTDAANTNGQLLSGRNDKRKDGRHKQTIKLEPFDGSNFWEKFPTQSPVCGGNDGIPGELSDISISKWRAEAIKSLGNSMVPQVVYEIFKAIEYTEDVFSSKQTV